MQKTIVRGKMELFEKKIEGKEWFKGKILTLNEDKVLLENGEIGNREYVTHPGGVCIGALTKDKELLFVKQFRYPYGKVVMELPAGKLDREEKPLEAAKREQREETGTISSKYIFLGEIYPTPGYSNEVIYMYACRVEEEVESKLDADEFLICEKIPVQKAIDMVLANEIIDAKSQIGVLKIAALLEKGLL